MSASPQQDKSNEVTTEELGRTVMCRQAFFDAAHDYGHGIVKSRQVIADIVRETTPCDSQTVYGVESPTHTPGSVVNLTDATSATVNEDAFLQQYVLAPGAPRDSFTMPNDPVAAKAKLEEINSDGASRWSKFVGDNYLVKAIFRPGISHPCPEVTAKDKGTWYKDVIESQEFADKIGTCGAQYGELRDPSFWQRSYIQETLNEWGVGEEVFCICDTDKGNVREDLAMANPAQTYYWLQTPQTLFDPAGKLQWAASSGAARSTGFFKPESPIKYAWQTATPGIRRSMLYPAWPLTESQTWSTDLRRDAPGALEQQMCANVSSVMLNTLGSSNNPYAPRNQDGVLQIEDIRKGQKTGKFVYITSRLASRNFQTTSPSSSAVSSYVKEGSQFLADLAASITGVGGRTPSDVFGMYANHHLFMGKRFGDGAQAAACTQESIPYSIPSDLAYADPRKEIKTAEQVKDKTADGQPLMSNGNHMFVTIDRIAAATALVFYAPMILYSGTNGMILFVRKDLPDPSKRLQSLLTPAMDNVDGTVAFNPEVVGQGLSALSGYDAQGAVQTIMTAMGSIDPAVPMTSKDGKLMMVSSWTSNKGAPQTSTRGVSALAAASESFRCYLGMVMSLGPTFLKAVDLKTEKDGLQMAVNALNNRYAASRAGLEAMKDVLSRMGDNQAAPRATGLLQAVLDAWPEGEGLLAFGSTVVVSTVPKTVGPALGALGAFLVGGELGEGEEQKTLLKLCSDSVAQLSAVLRDAQTRATAAAASTDGVKVDMSDEGLRVTSYVQAIQGTASDDPQLLRLGYLYSIIPRSCLSNISGCKPHSLFELRLGSRMRKMRTLFGRQKTAQDDTIAQLQQQLTTATTRSNEALGVTTLIQPAWESLTTSTDPSVFAFIDDFRSRVISSVYSLYLKAGGDSGVSYSSDISAASLFMAAINTLGNIMVPAETMAGNDITADVSGFARALAVINPGQVQASLSRSDGITLRVPALDSLSRFDDIFKSKTTPSAPAMSGGGQHGGGPIGDALGVMQVLAGQPLQEVLSTYVQSNLQQLASYYGDQVAMGRQLMSVAANPIAAAAKFDNIMRRLYTPLLLQISRYRAIDGEAADLTIRFGGKSASYSRMFEAISIYLLKANLDPQMMWNQTFEVQATRQSPVYVELDYVEQITVPKGQYRQVPDGVTGNTLYQFDVELPHMRDETGKPVTDEVTRAKNEATETSEGLVTYLGRYCVVYPMPESVRALDPSSPYVITFSIPAGAIDIGGTQTGRALMQAIKAILSGDLSQNIADGYNAVMEEGAKSLVSKDDIARTQIFFNAVQTQIDDGRSPDAACGLASDPIAALVAYQDWYNGRLATGTDVDMKLDTCMSELGELFTMDAPQLVMRSTRRRMPVQRYGYSGGKVKRDFDSMVSESGIAPMTQPDPKRLMIETPAPSKEQVPETIDVDAEDALPDMEAKGDMAAFLEGYLSMLGEFDASGMFQPQPDKIAQLRDRIYNDLTLTPDEVLIAGGVIQKLVPVKMEQGGAVASVERDVDSEIAKAKAYMSALSERPAQPYVNPMVVDKPMGMGMPMMAAAGGKGKKRRTRKKRH